MSSASVSASVTIEATRHVPTQPGACAISRCLGAAASEKPKNNGLEDKAGRGGFSNCISKHGLCKGRQRRLRSQVLPGCGKLWPCISLTGAVAVFSARQSPDGQMCELNPVTHAMQTDRHQRCASSANEKHIAGQSSRRRRQDSKAEDSE